MVILVRKCDIVLHVAVAGLVKTFETVQHITKAVWQETMS